MGFDLSNHFPLGNEDGFKEKGYTFKGWQPENDQAQRIMVVQAFDGDGNLVREAASRMNHPNIFGPDVEDMAMFEKVTDDLIDALPDLEAS